ncbi:Zn-dependent hydrolase [Paenibacillus glycinis]|uniref:Hydantoinase/carbamoylase family amidase n=1 Tax=Paenibacillus glycinis TaxID=2697035 RepID=A0ABW9XKX5_9BACL|nr:Zn-dependent hydrolase [Paenibacillus glycinis]NBD23259.1 hydantoinase/carbamoylase family amidase [Paenibacillus glycinis]
MEASEAYRSTTRLLERFSAVGADPEGGVTRLLYDAAWREAQRMVAGLMREAGLAVSVDEVGNVYGRLAGTDGAASSVLTGSHIDTVRRGGRYDGALGIAAAIAALSRLKREYGPPRRTLEAVSFCEEEGSRFPLAYWGSGHVTGGKRFDGSLDAVDSNGISLRAAMLEAGFDPEAGRLSRRSDIGAFAELHIEQGEVLERERCDIGIVDAIFGQRRYFVDVEGRAGHAGTTPMAIRADALAAAAEMIVWLRQAAVAAGDGLVATVGMLDAMPNVANVIPGKVRFSLDVRHRDEDALQAFCERTFAAFGDIADRNGVKASLTCWLAERPSPMDAKLQAEIARICADKGYSCRGIGSGAGHDAGLFAAVCRTAMIFVPSRGGISHAPEEDTAPEQLECGTDVLTGLLYALAYGEEEL